MNLNATPETVKAITQVFKLSAILDDRAPAADMARMAAWAEQVERHKLTEDDLLSGLQSYYDSPHDRPMGVGDLIQHAKVARRKRVDDESRAELNARQAHLDAVKPEPDAVRAIASAFGGGPVPAGQRTDRLQAAENSLQTCVDRKTAMAAIREYFAAKAEALKPTPGRSA